jgi:hypothetical protein
MFSNALMDAKDRANRSGKLPFAVTGGQDTWRDLQGCDGCEQWQVYELLRDEGPNIS